MGRLVASIGRVHLVVIWSLVVLGVAAQPVSAASPPRPGVKASGGAQDGPIAWYASRFGIDRDEAQHRLGLQSRVPHLADELVKRLGRGYAQSWFDNEQGGWVIAISPSGTRAAATQALSELGLPASVVQRDYDHVQLAAAEKALAKRVRAVAPGRATVAVGAAGLAVEIGGDATQAERQAIAQAVAESTVEPVVRQRESPLAAPAPLGCAMPFCAPLVAGIAWQRAFCTAAFSVGSPVDARPFMLTAGHCIRAGADWLSCYPGGNPCPWGGDQIAGYYAGGGGDGGLMRLDDTVYWSLWPAWVNWWDGSITGVAGWDDVAPGRAVCKNGQTTGSSCGVVTNSSWSGTYDENDYLTGMVQVEGACSAKGDSGGPVTDAIQPLALGITSGASLDALCGFTYYEPVGRALGTLGVWMKTA